MADHEISIDGWGDDHGSCRALGAQGSLQPLEPARGSGTGRPLTSEADQTGGVGGAYRHRRGRARPAGGRLPNSQACDALNWPSTLPHEAGYGRHQRHECGLLDPMIMCWPKLGGERQFDMSAPARAPKPNCRPSFSGGDMGGDHAERSNVI